MSPFISLAELITLHICFLMSSIREKGLSILHLPKIDSSGVLKLFTNKGFSKLQFDFPQIVPILHTIFVFPFFVVEMLRNI